MNGSLIEISASAALIVVAVATLIRTMGSSYGKIIEFLQAQNQSQQVQINTLQQGSESRVVMLDDLRKKVDAAEADCQKRLAAIEKKAVAQETILTTIRNGGAEGGK